MKNKSFISRLAVLLMVFLFLLSGCGQEKPPVKPEETNVRPNDTTGDESNSSNSEYDTLHYSNTKEPSPDADKVTLNVSDCLIEEEVDYTVTPLSQYVSDNGESKVYRYDISSDQITGSLNGFMEIRIPYDDTFFDEGEDPARCLSIHVINEDGSFDFELFDVDEENKEVIIYAEHLSERQLFHYRDELRAFKYDFNFGNAFVGNLSLEDYISAFKKFMKDVEVDPDSWNSDYHKWAEIKDTLIEVPLSAMYGTLVKVFPEGLNAQLYDASSWLSNASNILALGGKYTQSYMNRGMTMLGKLGIYTSMCKLSYELQHLKYSDRVSNEEVLSLYKTYINTALDYMAYYQSGSIVPMVSMYMSGVFVFGLLIDSMFAEARYMKMEDMGKIYEYYGDSYVGKDYKPRSNLEWYEIFMDIIDRYCAAGKQEYIQDAVDREIRLYAEAFWDLDPETVAQVTYDAGFKRMPYPTESEIETLTGNYISNLHYRLTPVMYECEKTMMKRNQKAVLEQLRKTYNNLNYKTTLRVQDGNKEIIYGGCWFKFMDLKPEADQKIFKGQLDKKGRFETKFSLNDWVFAGVPTRVELYESESDMEKGKNPIASAKIVLGEKAADPSTVTFLQEEEVVFKLDSLIYETHNDNYGSCPLPEGISVCEKMDISCTKESCHLDYKKTTYHNGRIMEESEGITYGDNDLSDIANPALVVSDASELDKWICEENKHRGVSDIYVHLSTDQDLQGYRITVGDTNLLKGSFKDCWPQVEEGMTVYVRTTGGFGNNIGYLFKAVRKDASFNNEINHIEASPSDYLNSEKWRK